MEAAYTAGAQLVLKHALQNSLYLNSTKCNSTTISLPARLFALTSYNKDVNDSNAREFGKIDCFVAVSMEITKVWLSLFHFDNQIYNLLQLTI